MKLKFIVFLVILSCLGMFNENIYAENNRKERVLILKGNALYKEAKYKEAQNLYQEALKENASSSEARYNLGLSQIRQVANIEDFKSGSNKLIEEAKRNFASVASLAKTKPGLAAKANYNLGNIEFNSEQFQKAIDYYKQALRIDPNDNNARENLRIAQLKLQNQNQDKNKDKDKDKKQDQDKDKKDENKDQNKQNDQNEQQNKDQQKNKNNMNDQTASQILESNNKNEAATRNRYNASMQKREAGANAGRKRW